MSVPRSRNRTIKPTTIPAVALGGRLDPDAVRVDVDFVVVVEEDVGGDGEGLLRAVTTVCIDSVGMDI
jgi:hypothetical protein